MGRTSQPLTIWVWKPWEGRPEVLDLRAKGHDIQVMDFDGTPPYYTMSREPDLILHPRAHRWEPGWWDEPAFLAAALTRARREKKGTP